MSPLLTFMYLIAVAWAATIPDGYDIRKRVTPGSNDYLSQINSIRAKVALKPALKPLVWDTSLESKAQTMAKSCQLSRGGPSPVFLHSFPSSSKNNLETQIKAAFQEIARPEAITAYKAGKHTAAGDLSQLLVDGSTKIGCAVNFVTCSGNSKQTFYSPPGGYETNCVNMPPTLLGAASIPVLKEGVGEKGENEWVRPLVDMDVPGAEVPAGEDGEGGSGGEGGGGAA